MAKLIVTFRNLANAPNNVRIVSWRPAGHKDVFLLQDPIDIIAFVVC